MTTGGAFLLLLVGVIVILGMRKLDPDTRPWTLDHVNCGIGMIATAASLSLALMWIAVMP